MERNVFEGAERNEDWNEIFLKEWNGKKTGTKYFLKNGTEQRAEPNIFERVERNKERNETFLKERNGPKTGIEKIRFCSPD